MAYTDDTTLLQHVMDAIQAIVLRGAQSWTIAMPGGGSRTFTALQIKELRQMQAELEAKIARATSGSFGLATPQVVR